MTMKPEYKAEMHAQVKALRSILQNHQRNEAACRRQISALKRDIEAGRRATVREIEIIQQRAALLKARLDS